MDGNKQQWLFALVYLQRAVAAGPVCAAIFYPDECPDQAQSPGARADVRYPAGISLAGSILAGAAGTKRRPAAAGISLDGYFRPAADRWPLWHGDNPFFAEGGVVSNDGSAPGGSSFR